MTQTAKFLSACGCLLTTFVTVPIVLFLILVWLGGGCG